MKAIETTEKAVQTLEDSSTFGTGLSSGLTMICQLIRDDDSFKTACEAFKKHPMMLPVLLDRISKYLQVSPGQYEHPNDVTVLAFMLLVEDVYGPESSEFKVVIAAADLLPNPWRTSQFIERMRAASQSGP